MCYSSNFVLDKSIILIKFHVNLYKINQPIAAADAIYNLFIHLETEVS
jgi:hypothetical protein